MDALIAEFAIEGVRSRTDGSEVVGEMWTCAMS
jgi:hypothetical protein